MRIFGQKAGLRIDHVSVGALIRVAPGGKHAWFESPNGPVRKPIVKGARPSTSYYVPPAVKPAPIFASSTPAAPPRLSWWARAWRWFVGFLPANR